jgi:apolipoprotein N-acyltransferase
MNTESPVTVSPARSQARRLAAPRAFKIRFHFRTLPFPRLLPALATAGLLWLCYFPVAWGWLGWLALVPILCLVRADGRPGAIYLAAWVGGMVFFWSSLAWMRVADYRMYYTWAMLATYCSLYFPVGVFLIRRLDRTTSLPLILTVPAVWTGLEFIRSFLLTGFAWYYLGHTQHSFLPMIQIADLAGAYGVSFVVAAVNALLFELLFAVSWVRAFLKLGDSPDRTQPRPVLVGWFTPGKWLTTQALVVCVLVGAVLVYGFQRLEVQTFEPGPRLAMLQGNIRQRLRNAVDDPNGRKALNQIYLHYGIRGKLFPIALKQGPHPDLVIWPETSFPYNWWEVAAGLPTEKVPEDFVEWGSEVQPLIQRLGVQWKTHFLLGLNTNYLDEHAQRHRYNSALLVSPSGTWSRYDKMHRIPFGEYVPLRDWLPFMNKFAPYDFDYSIEPGEHFTRLALGKHRFGVVICYEDTDPALARQYGRESADGPPVDFLVNISNDGWFDGTCEHEEHLAICRFRAIECRRAVARAVNMGVSAVIDGNGRVLAPQGDPFSETYANWEITNSAGSFAELPESRWHEFKNVVGVLAVNIPIDHRTSPYAYLGDWLPLACWALIFGGLGWVIIRARPDPRIATTVKA